MTLLFAIPFLSLLVIGGAWVYDLTKAFRPAHSKERAK